MNVMQELFKRRVPQICGIYLGAIFAGVEFTDMMVERYGLSDRLIDGVLIGMLACLPTVIMVAWFHGAPGRDKWRRRELVGVPLNLIAAIGLVMVFNPENPVEAASQIRSATDENGETVTVEVPVAAHVDRIAVFFLDPEGMEQETTWETYALSLLMESRFDANPFATTYTLYQNYSNGNIWKFKRAGYSDGLNAPLSLLQKVAQDYHQDYFLTGALKPLQNNRWQADLLLYQVDNEDLLLKVSLTADTLFDLADVATETVTQKLQPPSNETSKLSSRLPSKELVTESRDALRLLVEGKNALTFDTDVDTAIARWTEAVALDPGFTQVYLALAALNEGIGNNDEALANLKELNRLSHELSEKEKIRIKAWIYSLKNEPDRATRVYEMWTELYDDDPDAWLSLGYSYRENGNRLEQAIAAWEKSLEHLPSQHWLINEVASLQRILGRNEDAIANYERYKEVLPENYLPAIAIGDIKTDQGDLEGAEFQYQQGQLAQTNMVTPVIRLAMNQLRRGNISEAEALLEEADFVAEAPRQLSSLAAIRSKMYATLGQPSKALEQSKEKFAIESQSLGQIDAIVAHMRNMELYAITDKTAEAEAFLAQISPGFKPPYDFIPSVGYMILAMAEGKLDEAEFHNQKIAKGLTDSGRIDLEFVVQYTRGIIERQRGEIELAVASLRQAATSFRGSAQFTDEDSRAEYEKILLELSQTLLQMGQPQQAVEALEPLLLSWPYHPEGNWLSAQAYHALGDTQQANASLAIAQDMWAEAEDLFVPAQEANAGLENLPR
ncbi:MAG: tetratricopeptide repeat protein [Lysobacterales bacterium]